MADDDQDNELPIRPTPPRKKKYGGLNTDITEGTDAIGGSAEENTPEEQDLRDLLEQALSKITRLETLIFGPGGPGSGAGDEENPGLIGTIEALADALGPGGSMEGAQATSVTACEDGEPVTLTLFAKKS